MMGEVNNMEAKKFDLNDIVEMKKQHPCGTNEWKIIRMGADVRIKCEGCQHSVMIPRREFEKKMKKIIKRASEV
ncbi:Bacterial protein of uncharacterised function (DUF951) [Lysinibacillus sphaericus]|uniref:Bacterial protein of uncharacterized function (DUF951) n=5 Tax=Lysinibacillus TaxID=400634 RepID=A0AAJ4ZZK8_LYSSH|nr:Bacterial protein of uncharacterised function (DUF951) [Lysinibacillus sphaericus]